MNDKNRTETEGQIGKERICRSRRFGQNQKTERRTDEKCNQIEMKRKRRDIEREK